MLNAPKPVHINVTVTAGVAAGASATDPQYNYEDVPDGGVALKVTVPGMGLGAAPPTGNRATWRKASWIWIRNMAVAATDTVHVSFDNGNTFMTIQAAVVAAGAWDTFQASLSFRYFYLRAAANAPTVECIVGINGPN